MSGPLVKRRSRGFGIPHLDAFPSFRSMENMISHLLDDGDERWLGGALVPTLNVSETDDEVDVTMDLPGMQAEEIDIQVHNNVLTIQGERVEESDEKNRKFHRIERRSGSFSRSVSLPTVVEEESIDAQYEDGVLTIRMPKSKEAQAKKIVVKT